MLRDSVHSHRTTCIIRRRGRCANDHRPRSRSHRVACDHRWLPKMFSFVWSSGVRTFQQKNEFFSLFVCVWPKITLCDGFHLHTKQSKAKFVHEFMQYENYVCGGGGGEPLCVGELWTSDEWQWPTVEIRGKSGIFVCFKACALRRLPHCVKWPTVSGDSSTFNFIQRPKVNGRRSRNGKLSLANKISIARMSCSIAQLFVGKKWRSSL